MKVSAVGYLVVVKPDPVKDKTASGIYLAADKKLERNATTIGTVVEVGPIAFKAYKPYMCDWVEPGDRIAYVKYAGRFVPADPDKDDPDSELLVISDSDVVAKYVD